MMKCPTPASGALARLGVAAAVTLAPVAALAAPLEITVYESPSCTCCSGWIAYLETKGFKVVRHVMNDVTPAKDKLGVPPELRSCHTAQIGGYAVEGHVPAQSIERMLRERPKATGIAAPGMPSGAPGMDTAYKPYDVILFGKGTQSVYAQF